MTTDSLMITEYDLEAIIATLSNNADIIEIKSLYEIDDFQFYIVKITEQYNYIDECHFPAIESVYTNDNINLLDYVTNDYKNIFPVSTQMVLNRIDNVVSNQCIKAAPIPDNYKNNPVVITGYNIMQIHQGQYVWRFSA